MHSWATLSAVAQATPKKVGDPLTFYSVSATIIPVLFLALVYQTPYLKSDSRPHTSLGMFQYYVAFFGMIVAFSGEVAALHVLSTQEPTRGSKQAVETALILFGTAIVSEPFFRVLGRYENSTGERWFTKRENVLGSGVVGVWLVAIAAVLGVNEVF